MKKRFIVVFLFVALLVAVTIVVQAQECRICDECDPTFEGFHNCMARGGNCINWDVCPTPKMGFYF